MWPKYLIMKLTFKPEQVTKNLLAVLPERSRDVIERRYGLLNGATERMTLESIGQIYDITRERVRQIENSAIEMIKTSEAYNKSELAFIELEDSLIKYGGLAHEDQFLNDLTKSESTQNHVNFLLVVGDSFVKIKEDDHFHHRWTVDEDLSGKVHTAIQSLYKTLSQEDLISESDMILKFMDSLHEQVVDQVTEELAKRWLTISKRIKPNALGDWGLVDSPNIKTRGMRDMAYLVLKKRGTPLHFSEVARIITDEFDKKAHVATCHNELIKDSRFVLVGRGLYALSEWGYTSGVVRDVIKSIIKKKGPLTKAEIINEVKKQRQVKDNTIYVNLQNNKHFKKDTKGRYTLA